MNKLVTILLLLCLVTLLTTTVSAKDDKKRRKGKRSAKKRNGKGKKRNKKGSVSSASAMDCSVTNFGVNTEDDTPINCAELAFNDLNNSTSSSISDSMPYVKATKGVQDKLDGGSWMKQVNINYNEDGFQINGQVNFYRGVGWAYYVRVNEKAYQNFTNTDNCFAENDPESMFHIHYGADFSGSGIAAECGPSFTGGHYDPTLACGGASGNNLCKGTDTPAGRNIPGASASVYNNDYPSTNCQDKECPLTYGTNCNGDREKYVQNPYLCEVGDLSGKAGKAKWTKRGWGRKAVYTTSGIFTGDKVDYFDVLGDKKQNAQAVVFHCAGGSQSGARLFCGSFH